MEYDIRCYGAVGDGATINTCAIQRAIDDCAAEGGGIGLCRYASRIRSLCQKCKGDYRKQVRCTAPESEKRPEKYFDNCETICEKEETL